MPCQCLYLKSLDVCSVCRMRNEFNAPSCFSFVFLQRMLTRHKARKSSLHSAWPSYLKKSLCVRGVCVLKYTHRELSNVCSPHKGFCAKPSAPLLLCGAHTTTSALAAKSKRALGSYLYRNGALGIRNSCRRCNCISQGFAVCVFKCALLVQTAACIIAS